MGMIISYLTRQGKSFSDSGNLSHAFNLFYFAYKVVKMLGIIHIQHYSTFKSTGIAINVYGADIQVIFAGNKAGNVVEYSHIVNSTDLDTRQEGYRFSGIPFSLYNAVSKF